MTRQKAIYLHYSEEEISRLRASYLQKNSTRFSVNLVTRVLAMIVAGVVLLAVSMVAVERMFTDLASDPTWKNVSRIILSSVVAGLIIWVNRWDDRRRFEAFLQEHRAQPV